MKTNDWWVRNVPEATKRIYKAYAAANGITLAEALSIAAQKLKLK